ncbi:hypothetical protein VINI7043_11581 [Vibrio nigripulchritudo ATCC 27043]|nr:hypothetical protein VINI7043_11581 [Vibrio nigripulchritudo ATCC 27043]
MKLFASFDANQESVKSSGWENKKEYWEDLKPVKTLRSFLKNWKSDHHE